MLREAGVRGARADRPVLAQALGMIKSGEADAIMVSRLDRLACDVVLQEVLLAEVAAAGGAIMSATPSEDDLLAADPSDPGRKLMRQLIGAIAEYVRSVIALRLGRWPSRQGPRRRQGLRLVPVRPHPHRPRRPRAGCALGGLLAFPD